jgi:hypothetical protein
LMNCEQEKTQYDQLLHICVCSILKISNQGMFLAVVILYNSCIRATEKKVSVLNKKNALC